MQTCFKKSFVISIIVLYFLSSICFASFIRQTSLDFYANQYNTINVEMTIDYETLTTDDISFVIYSKIKNVEGFDENGKLDCLVNEKTYGSQIICTRIKNIQENYSINLNYEMENVIFEEKKLNKTIDTFLFEYGIIEPTDELRILFVIPEGYGLLDANNNYPSEGNIKVIDGRRVGIEWIEENLTIGKSRFFKVQYEKITKPVVPNDEEEDPINYKLTLSVIIVVLLGIIIILSFSKTKKTKKKKTTESEKKEESENIEALNEETEKKNIEDVMLISLLKPDEKKVFDLICASGNGITKQRQIARTTKFSPAKVSHIVKSLSVRGLVEVIRQGRTTRIELTKKANDFLKVK